jgi:hypothetical protein
MRKLKDKLVIVIVKDRGGIHIVGVNLEPAKKFRTKLDDESFSAAASYERMMGDNALVVAEQTAIAPRTVPKFDSIIAIYPKSFLS